MFLKNFTKKVTKIVHASVVTWDFLAIVPWIHSKFRCFEIVENAT